MRKIGFKSASLQLSFGVYDKKCESPHDDISRKNFISERAKSVY